MELRIGFFCFGFQGLIDFLFTVHMGLLIAFVDGVFLYHLRFISSEFDTKKSLYKTTCLRDNDRLKPAQPLMIAAHQKPNSIAQNHDYSCNTTHSAWISPGTKKKRHNRILINKSLPIPFLSSTATGGSKIARMTSNNLLESMLVTLFKLINLATKIIKIVYDTTC